VNNPKHSRIPHNKKKTFKKLGIKFWDYLLDRLHGTNKIQALASLIEMRVAGIGQMLPDFHVAIRLSSDFYKTAIKPKSQHSLLITRFRSFWRTNIKSGY
jgi:hypothetical protein